MLTLQNGTVKQTMTRAEFMCDEMFYLEGPSALHCVDGEWAGALSC